MMCLDNSILEKRVVLAQVQKINDISISLLPGYTELLKVSQSQRVISIINNHLLSFGKAFLTYFPEIWETECI